MKWRKRERNKKRELEEALGPIHTETASQRNKRKRREQRNRARR